MNSRLIKNGYVVTVDDNFAIYPDGAIFIEDGRIVDIGESDSLGNKYRNVEVIDANGKAVLPGLVNTHVHSGLIRGTAEDLPLWEWLMKHVDPMHKALTSDEAYVAARLCYAESLMAGTTCVMDMYRFMDRCADAAEELGIRAILVPYVADKPEYDYFESLKTNIELVESRHGTANGRIHVWFGLEHLVYATEETYKRIADLLKKYPVGFHTHADESIEMVERIKENYGRSPIQLFYDRGILGPKTVLAHCCWLTPTEMEILAKTETSIAHCPVSNMKLASGVAAIPECLDRGIKVGLGSDGVKENNNLDLFEEMKFASLLQKLHHLDAAKMPAEKTLKLATINGARALGLDDEIGSLEVGKKADIILVDLQKLHLAPHIYGKYENIVANLVFSANGSDVDTVLVDGEIVMQNRRLLTADVTKLIGDANEAVKDLFIRRKPFVPDDISMDSIEV